MTPTTDPIIVAITVTMVGVISSGGCVTVGCKILTYGPLQMSPAVLQLAVMLVVDEC